jgi:hypothetical protein
MSKETVSTIGNQKQQIMPCEPTWTKPNLFKK